VSAPAPIDPLVVQRAAAGRTLDEIALDLALDDCALLRAWGQRESRWLDYALRVKRAYAVRVLDAYRRQAIKSGRA